MLARERGAGGHEVGRRPLEGTSLMSRPPSLHRVEQPGIRRRIAAPRSLDRGLVDPTTPSRRETRALDQRALARAGHARHHHQRAQRDVREDARHALEVFAASDALRQNLGTPVPPAEVPDREAGLARTRTKLTSSAFRAAWSAGGSAELDQVIDHVLEALGAVSGSAEPAADPRDLQALTRREHAVLELLAAGATNREIAAALYISPSTAGVHVSNILRKLRAKRRVDAAGIAHKLGLLPVR
jgi:DNA-binding CsgD family transcriptional regulator